MILRREELWRFSMRVWRNIEKVAKAVSPLASLVDFVRGSCASSLSNRGFSGVNFFLNTRVKSVGVLWRIHWESRAAIRRDDPLRFHTHGKGTHHVAPGIQRDGTIRSMPAFSFHIYHQRVALAATAAPSQAIGFSPLLFQQWG